MPYYFLSRPKGLVLCYYLTFRSQSGVPDNSNACLNIQKGNNNNSCKMFQSLKAHLIALTDYNYIFQQNT